MRGIARLHNGVRIGRLCLWYNPWRVAFSREDECYYTYGPKHNDPLDYWHLDLRLIEVAWRRRPDDGTV